jgi:N6-L-threonylcarbamoyladenine synthase
MSLILGIETSCDECSASVVQSSDLTVKSVATFSQIQLHQPFGGVVPEVASRNHLLTINTMVEEALKEASISLQEIDAIAVTNRPGLVGALLVGVTAAKALAYGFKKPLIAVHHLEGHASSVFLDQEAVDPEDPSLYPMLTAIVSGGHSNLYAVKQPPSRWPEDFLKKSLIARSRDDAAGEAFDKTAKLLGFPYPGGMWIDQHSQGGRSNAFNFPRALPQKNILDFSFSGLKTAVALQIRRIQDENKFEESISDLCASIQEAIVDALLKKIFLATKRYQCRSIALVGGVASNSRLRARLESEAPVRLLFPKKEYCTDNAAMIAAAGAFRFHQEKALSQREMLILNAKASASC